MILLVGSNGNMGKRYACILKHLGVKYTGLDLGCKGDLVSLARKSEGVIIATPTDTHYKILNELDYGGVTCKILCEKPITKDPEELSIIGRMKLNISMVLQYRYALETATEDPAGSHNYYNYFRHGTDSLVWDCIQIVALSKGIVLLREQSPIWKCSINGKVLNIAHMDQAYISMIEDWIEGEFSFTDFYKAHYDIINAIGGKNESVNFRSSEEH